LGLTIFLIVAPVVVFCIYVARKFFDDYSDHWGVSIMAVAIAFTIYVSLSLSLSHTHTYNLFLSLYGVQLY
jgi:palmitoyltransferase ZDHHC9/14/18